MPKLDTAATDFDHEHIWHPYTSMINPPAVYPVESAKGVYIKLADGRELIDGMGSWWSVIHGYGHPRLNKAAHDQIDKMAHVMFGGLTHSPAIEVSRQLVEITPSSLEKVFLADSGSIAVEVSLKMAIQYWHAKGQTNKTQFMTVRNGYHGDTFGAMSVCDPINGMHELFTGMLPQQHFTDAPELGMDTPLTDKTKANLRDFFIAHSKTSAAFIIEPVVQGAGGMRIYNPDYVAYIHSLCQEFSLLFIADEIATGFGRTGKMFACEHAQVVPDILCLGKAITGGYMSLAATLTTKEIGETISKGGAGCFMHGPTFMGNPLACAVATESLKVLRESDWQAKVLRIETHLKKGLAPAKEIPAVADVRCIGAIGVIEMKSPVNTPALQEQMIEQGLWLRPFGKLVYVMPPYTMNTDQLTKLTQGMIKALKGYLAESDLAQ